MLLGANGAGKATTVRAMAGILPVTTGHAGRDARRIDGDLWQQAHAVADQLPSFLLVRSSRKAPEPSFEPTSA